MAATGGTGERRDEEVALRDLLLLLYRRRFLLVLCMALGGLAGIAVLALVPPVYVARAFILIEPGRDGGGSTVASASETLDSASLDSQVRILASRSLARDVLAELAPATPLPPSPLQRLAQFLPPALAAPGGAADAPPADPVDAFLAGLVVKREGKSHVIEIAYRSLEPERAAMVANRLAERYMLAQRLRKEEAARRRTGWYDERLAFLQNQLGKTERALRDARAADETEVGEILAAGPDELAGLNIQLVTAAVDRSSQETLLARVRRSVESGEGADAVAQFGATPLLANLSALKAEVLRREAELTARYGDRHPKILDVRAERTELDARLRQERRSVVHQLETDLEQARAKEAVLATKLAELKGTAVRREVSAGHLRDLQHEVEVNRRLLDAHLAKANDAERPRAEPGPDARVLSEAVAPKDPSFPDPRLILSLSLSGGFFFGLAALYIAQSGERGFQSPHDVEATLGLPTLALVPRIDARAGGPPPEDYVLDRPRSRCAESLRALLAGLVRPRGDGRPAPRVVLVTSSLPREGKSTLTLSLARIAAGEGMRVIVIDADLRKPRLHELLGLKDRAGLVEVLRREVTLAEAVVKDPKAPLHLLPGSRRLAQPTRILGPNGLGTLFNALRGSFDLVLVDSAPLAAVADAKLLAGLVDTVLYAVRYGDTRRDFCKSCLQGLRESGAEIAGAVLTQVDLGQHRRLFAREAGPSGKRVADYYAD